MVNAVTAVARLMVAAAVMALGVQGSVPGTICCVANQMQLKQVYTYATAQRGNYQFGDVISDTVYDAVNERELFVTTRSDNLGPRVAYVYYMMYKDDMMYVYNNQTGMCIKNSLTKPFPLRCLPEAAPVTDRELTYGSGAETITASRVTFQAPRSDGTTLHGTLTVTAQCVPILETLLIFPQGGLKSESSEVTNVKLGAIPDSLFDLPPSCASAAVACPMYYPSISFDVY